MNKITLLSFRQVVIFFISPLVFIVFSAFANFYAIIYLEGAFYNAGTVVVSSPELQLNKMEILKCFERTDLSNTEDCLRPVAEKKHDFQFGLISMIGGGDLFKNNALVRILLDKENKKSNFVVFIEWLLVLCGALPLYLIFISNLFVDEYLRLETVGFNLMDWSLNAPPVLGVLANLFAFALIISSKSYSLDANFLKYFQEAVVTTILGGGIYVINLFLKSFLKDFNNS